MAIGGRTDEEPGAGVTICAWVAGAAALGFLLLALAVGQGWLLPLDRAALSWVAAQRDCASVRWAAGLSIVGAGEVSLAMTATAGAVCLLRRRPRAAASLLLLYLSIPIELALKHVVAQPLPGALYPIPPACEWYVPALSVRTPHSFPSGYAIRVTYFAALVVVLLAAGDGRILGLGTRTRRVAAVVVGVLLLGLVASRTVLSWHWPSDLVAGALLGLALAAASRGVALESDRGRAATRGPTAHAKRGAGDRIQQKTPSG
jgi:membrane-associated phospholipid phosphatase